MQAVPAPRARPRGVEATDRRRGAPPSTLPTHGPAPRQPQPGPMHDRNCNFNRGTVQKHPGGGAHKPLQCCLDVSGPSLNKYNHRLLDRSTTQGTLSRPQHRAYTNSDAGTAGAQRPVGARDTPHTRRRRLPLRPRATAEAPPPAAAASCWGLAGRLTSPVPHTARPWALAGAAMPERDAE